MTDVATKELVLEKLTIRPRYSRGQIVIGGGEQEMVFYDGHGIPRARLSLDHQGIPTLALNDANGQARAELQVSIHGDTMLNLNDANGTTRVWLVTGPNENTGLNLYDESQAEVNLRLEVGLRQDGSNPFIEFCNQGKEVIWHVPEEEYEQATLDRKEG